LFILILNFIHRSVSYMNAIHNIFTASSSHYSLCHDENMWNLYTSNKNRNWGI